MRFASPSTFLRLLLVAGLVSAQEGHVLKPRRTSSILNSPKAQPALPSPQQAAQAAQAASLNLDNIQGDILVGMKKTKELFFFFTINDPKSFKVILRNLIAPLITTTSQLLNVSKQPDTAMNLAFSHTGLLALGVTDDLNDTAFAGGQFADATFLGDPGTVNWVPALTGNTTHGVFLLASDTLSHINIALGLLEVTLGKSITKKYTLETSVRPGAEQGHEHFGFMDGISQPAVIGFNNAPLPGQSLIPAGEFLLGEDGDALTRPAWAKDGAFLAFRQLEQLVPEFNKFLLDNPITDPNLNLTPAQGSELLGARMVGRWKSGAPIDLTPFADDPVLAADPTRNNNFDFSHPGEDQTSNQTRCPFAAHIRKTRPRTDLNPVDTAHHIIRGGIPYGPEVSADEAASNTTKTERGLAFVAYQSNINQGFRFLQHFWVDNQNFVFGKNVHPGFDPLLGANNGLPRNTTGLDPANPTGVTTFLGDFIVSRGGEYFFSPSVSAIKGILSA